MSNKIAVVIIAHNRKQFLMDAVVSALRQTLNPLIYEIVVIKNFIDSDLDKRIIELSEIYGVNVNILFSSSERLGEKIIRAVDVSSGSQIVFLEDDDLFTEKKLEKVHLPYQR